MRPMRSTMSGSSGTCGEHIAKGTRTRLLVLNNFFGDETTVGVPAEFMPGEVLDAVAGSEGSRVPAEVQSARCFCVITRIRSVRLAVFPAPIPARLRLHCAPTNRWL